MSESERLINQNRSCDTLSELLPAYGLGITDDHEARLVEQLLSQCPEEAALLPEYLQLGERLLYSVPQVEPPAHLLSNILKAAEADSPKVTALPQRRINGWLVAAAAVFVLVVAFNIWAINRTLQLSNTVSSQTAMLSLFARDEVLSFELLDIAEDPTAAQAVLICHPDETVGVVRAENFPVAALPGDYHLWLWYDEEHRVDAGIITMDDNGNGTLVFQAPEEMRHFKWVSITSPIVTEGERPDLIVRGNLYPTETPTPAP